MIGLARTTLLALSAFATNAALATQNDTDPLRSEADALIRAVWNAQLRSCGSSSFKVLDGRVVLELEEPRFHLAPTRLQAPAKQNGYEFQTTAIASARRWRWAPLTGAGALRWNPWQEGQPMTVRFDQTGGERGQTTVQDAVLQFDLVRRHGKWQANHPLSPLNSDFKSLDPATAAPSAAMPSCQRLTGGTAR